MNKKTVTFADGDGWTTVVRRASNKPLHRRREHGPPVSGPADAELLTPLPLERARPMAGSVTGAHDPKRTRGVAVSLRQAPV